MSDFVCGSCGGAVPEHELRGTGRHEAGEIVCAHCGARLAAQRPSRRAQYFYLLSIGAMIACAPLLFAGQVPWKVAGAAGLALFVGAAVHSYRSSRRLAVLSRDGA